MLGENFAPGEAIVLTPAQAQTALQCGPTRLWELINAGEIESFLDGTRRRITAKSIRDYVARKLAASPTKKVVPTRRGQRRAPANWQTASPTVDAGHAEKAGRARGR